LGLESFYGARMGLEAVPKSTLLRWSDGKKGTLGEEFVAWVLRRHIYWRGFAAVGVFEDGRPDRSRDSPATAVSCAWSG